MGSIDKKYIYESPDGGKTVNRREFGSAKKETIVVSSNDKHMPFDLSLCAPSLTGINEEVRDDIVLTVNGETRSVSELFTSIDAIEKRLAILRPDPKLLDQYELLQGLYEQYKAAEALLYENDKEEQ